MHFLLSAICKQSPKHIFMYFSKKIVSFFNFKKYFSIHIRLNLDLIKLLNQLRNYFMNSNPTLYRVISELKCSCAGHGFDQMYWIKVETSDRVEVEVLCVKDTVFPSRCYTVSFEDCLWIYTVKSETLSGLI